MLLFRQYNLNNSMSDLFKKAFFRTLREADELPAVVPTPTTDTSKMSDADAMQSTLDAGTEPTDFDIHSGSREAALAAAKSHSMMVDALNQWIIKIDDFIEFLNGQNTDSVQTHLAKADDKSLLGAIKTAESKKIGLVCKELAGLAQMLKTYSASSGDPRYRGS